MTSQENTGEDMDNPTAEILDETAKDTEVRLMEEEKRELKEQPLSKNEEIAGYKLMDELVAGLERRAYERVVQVVRGMHAESVVIQRYRGSPPPPPPFPSLSLFAWSRSNAIC